MSSRVAVVTDSAACLPAELAAAWGVTVVPLQVTIDGTSWLEGAEGLGAKVLEALQEGRSASTSQPSVGACVEALSAAAEGAEAVVVVTLSSKMSGTYSVMELAAKEVGIPVRVVDSRTIALGHGFAALSAAAAARAGESFEDVVAEAERVARSALCLFTVETLEHLRRGGRVSPAVATLGTALNIRPVLGVLDGEVQSIDRVRTAAKARVAMLERIASRAPAMRTPVMALVGLAGDGDVVVDASVTLGRRASGPTLFAELSAVLAVHAGPGALAAIVADVRPELAAALVVPSHAP